MALPESKITGLRGEQFAAREYASRGYTIISANFVSYTGEIDIIVQDKKKELCFVEVKTRSVNTYVPPSEAVDYAKQERIISTAKAFIKQTKISYRSVRFDIAEVLLRNLYSADINIIENAFKADNF